MSYILEALKKSESERNQGRVPDLGQQIRMIHRKRRRGIPAAGWLAIALVINAVVLAALFWPGVGLWRSTPATAPEMVQPVTAPTAGDARSLAPEVAVTEPEAAEAGPFADDQDNSGKGMEASQTDLPGIDADSEDVVVLETPGEAPTVIVPTVRPVNPEGESDDAYSPTPWEGRVPHLVELPMAFQRQVPDLVFNSHVYSERRSARSVMINNRYLRMGDSFGPLTVERITEQGVELSMDGQRFRVGVVRDWSSPR